MITENQQWTKAKKEAIHFVEVQSWSKNIRFMMALRNEIQKRLDEHIKERENKNSEHTQ